MRQPFSIRVELDEPYDTALELVTVALQKEGFGVLTEIDVKVAMKEKLDKDFRPYRILGACNPLLAYKALLNEPQIGLVLPCNVTVEAVAGGGSIVSIFNPEALLSVDVLAQNDVVRDVVAEARTRLERVALALR